VAAENKYSNELLSLLMNRKSFLIEFLGALGAKEIVWLSDKPDYVSGIVRYSYDNPEEVQEFHWRIKEEDVPNDEIKQLAKLIKENHLLSIDRICIPMDKLRFLYNDKYGVIISKDKFEIILQELLNVKVDMVDDGRETDFYFIHN
jgi:hypothetical protein